jgi:hypothetical protein
MELHALAPNPPKDHHMSADDKSVAAPLTEQEAEIIRLFEEGGTYRSVAAELGIGTETIRQMLRDPARVEFQARYARARDEQGHAYADGVIDVSVDSSIPPDEKRVRIDALKWAAAKRQPKVYGDKITQEHTGANGAALVPVINVSLSKP